jgi:two-component system, OmpR family, response regulator RegX3
MTEVVAAPPWWDVVPARVLVVGDSENSPVFAEALRAEGYEVEVAAGASDCLRHYERPLDLVLLSTLRPGMPWTELCRRMQAKADVPIIVAARFESEIDAVLAFELGVTGYLSDPNRIREMIARVRAALRGVGPSGDPLSAGHGNAMYDDAKPFLAGALRIDMVGREVTVRGEPVYLARREFDLLSALLSPPGTVRTRCELIDRVWDGHGLEGSRTLDTHIRRLRLKLEVDPTAPKLLITVRGVGFLFDLEAAHGERPTAR